MTMQAESTLAGDFAPTGVLRVAINLGNALLAKQASAKQPPHGVSVDLANELAQRLHLPLELICVDGAAKAVAAVKTRQADLGFFAIDAQRGAGLHYSAAYLTIEGAYLVKNASPLHEMQQVDRAEHRVVVGNGSAYDLFLQQHLQRAEIVRVATSQQVVEHMLALRADIAAGVRQQLQADAEKFGGLRLLPGSFMQIHQAMAIAADRSHATVDYLDAFIDEMKSSGFLARSLQQHQICGVCITAAHAADAP
jgi:ABC-type amino acid transport substrate-binding protein